ncbi:copper amine oxidase [Ilyonectria robusta]|uniref:copper amine oxidase n=1 Tax=Ilyonectria robusta TaxID=1079257 RepID=UPI001E8E18CD|nr:copper amine oxidase [Ilyonectria robusta]KAH8714642.1 copper amine oxidase [Ilyonectria robusta]
MKSSILVNTLLGLALGVSAAPRRTWNVHSGPNNYKAGSVRRRAIEERAETCPVPVDNIITAPKTTPFKPLTEDELSSLVKFLLNEETGLNLTDSASPDLSMSDNYISHLEVLKPNKTDILNYLDGNATKVPRYARVTLYEGAAKVPGIVDYMVGPFPIGCDTKIKTLDYFYNGVNGPKVLVNAGYNDGPRSAAIDTIVGKTMASIADITLDLIDFAYYGSGDKRNNATYFVQNPSSKDGTSSLIWTPWRRTGLAPYDQPSDLYVSFDVTGTDPSLYSAKMVLYNLVVYETVDAFRKAYEEGKIIKSTPPTTNTTFLHKDRFGAVRKLEDRLAPTVLELDGKRYSVDNDNSYVEYLGWKFYTRFDRDVGIQFYDIKFKDERIMYELSLQDAIAQYSGNNPFQAGTAYMDRFYGIGAQASRLIPGYDCPYHATYWSPSFTDGTSTTNFNNTICIFETDIGTPITRHVDQSYVQATKGSKLVVRQVATVGNYDYLWDYSFYVDGTVSVDAHASGYVQGNYYRPDDEGKWGPRIAETIAGTLHTHVMNFKVDFDLLGTDNTFLKTEIVVKNVTQPWFPEHGEFEMMGYEFTELQTEDEGLLGVPANGQTMYTVINKDKVNKWGVPRGYRIVPGLSNVHLASMKSPFFLKSAEFAKQAFAVSRQKDSEHSSSAALNQNAPAAPLVEFWKFFDGEPLVQEDLVVWANLGMHHYTRSEDIPNTIMLEAHSNIMFAPQNWGDTEGTVDLTNAVIYNEDNVNSDGIVEPETNGVSPPDCLVLSPEDELLGVFET